MATVSWSGHEFWLVCPSGPGREGPPGISPRAQLPCASVTHKNRGSPSSKDSRSWTARRRWGLPFAPSHKPTPDVGKDEAGGGPAGRRTGLAKLPVTSQKFQGPPGVAPPQLAPLPAGRPRQQVLTAPLPFHPVTREQMKGREQADPGPGTCRSI